MRAAVTELATEVGTQAACHALCVPRGSYYRDRSPSSPWSEGLRGLARYAPWRRRNGKPSWPFSTKNGFRIALPPQSMRLCSMKGTLTARSATMYRLLAAQGESREPRDQLTHPPYRKPELLATAPNQLWSWDITKLLGPAEWTYFYLYLILDVFSRYVTGLDGRPARKRRTRQAPHPGPLHPTTHPAGSADAACRSRYLDALQAARLLTGRLGRHQDP